MSKRMSTAVGVIDYLNLQRDPAGNGWSKVIHHDTKQQCIECPMTCKRANSTTFVHLHIRSKVEYWHRTKSSLTQNFIAGSPLLIQTGDNNKIIQTQIMGNDFTSNNVPISLIEPNQWQIFSTTGDWSLTSGTYSPGFEFSDLEIAVEGWAPGQGEPALSFPGETWAPST